MNLILIVLLLIVDVVVVFIYFFLFLMSFDVLNFHFVFANAFLFLFVSIYCRWRPFVNAVVWQAGNYMQLQFVRVNKCNCVTHKCAVPFVCMYVLQNVRVPVKCDRLCEWVADCLCNCVCYVFIYLTWLKLIFMMYVKVLWKQHKRKHHSFSIRDIFNSHIFVIIVPQAKLWQWNSSLSQRTEYFVSF